MDAALESFLAVATARLAPKTIDAYRRDLTELESWLAGSPSGATTEQLEGYVTALRERGLSGATIARRIAAARSFYRHEMLLGARGDNPAAELDLPRRAKRLPKTLSPGEAERLIDAAAGTTPRAMRDHALVELLYGAGLRVGETVGLDKTGVDLDARLVRCVGKGSKERVVPLGRPAAEALRRYLAHGRPHLDRRHRPELFLNAQGGALTRAGAFLILRKLAAKAGLAGFTRVLAHEGAGHGIKVNAIAPIAATQMTEGILGDLAVKVSPGSVSPLVAYLAHAECSVRGNVYSVAGGRIARIFVGETQGLVLGENTPESIRSALAHRRRRHRWTPPAVVAGRRDDHHRQGAVGGVLTRSAPMSPDVR